MSRSVLLSFFLIISTNFIELEDDDEEINTFPVYAKVTKSLFKLFLIELLDQMEIETLQSCRLIIDKHVRLYDYFNFNDFIARFRSILTKKSKEINQKYETLQMDQKKLAQIEHFLLYDILLIFFDFKDENVTFEYAVSSYNCMKECWYLNINFFLNFLKDNSIKEICNMKIPKEMGRKLKLEAIHFIPRILADMYKESNRTFECRSCKPLKKKILTNPKINYASTDTWKQSKEFLIDDDVKQRKKQECDAKSGENLSKVIEDLRKYNHDKNIILTECYCNSPFKNFCSDLQRIDVLKMNSKKHRALVDKVVDDNPLKAGNCYLLLYMFPFIVLILFSRWMRN